MARLPAALGTSRRRSYRRSISSLILRSICEPEEEGEDNQTSFRTRSTPVSRNNLTGCPVPGATVKRSESAGQRRAAVARTVRPLESMKSRPPRSRTIRRALEASASVSWPSRTPVVAWSSSPSAVILIASPSSSTRSESDPDSMSAPRAMSHSLMGQQVPATPLTCEPVSFANRTPRHGNRRTPDTQLPCSRHSELDGTSGRHEASDSGISAVHVGGAVRVIDRWPRGAAAPIGQREAGLAMRSEGPYRCCTPPSQPLGKAGDVRRRFCFPLKAATRPAMRGDRVPRPGSCPAPERAQINRASPR